MRLVRFTLSSFALLLGGGILFVSLAASNSQVFSSTEGDATTSHKQFYLSQSILPDHVAYPLLMGVDRVKLETAGPAERIYIQLDYAQRRFGAAQALLEKQNPSLALTTLTKAEKYLLHAAQEAQDPHISTSLKEYTLKSLTYYDHSITTIKPSFTDSDQEVLTHLLEEMRVLETQLQSQLSAAQPATQN